MTSHPALRRQDSRCVLRNNGTPRYTAVNYSDVRCGGRREEMTVGRQLSYHCPSVVATLKQVELFVWQRGVLEGRRWRKRRRRLLSQTEAR